MPFSDLLSLAFSNIRRTKLRTFLTTSGVVIGIGALVSMVSFGLGIQKNVSDAMEKLEVFTEIRVLPQKIDLAGLMEGLQDDSEKMALNDSVLTLIKSLPHVRIAYPEIAIPAKLRLHGNEHASTIQAVPMDIIQFPPYNNLHWGSFFSSDTAAEIIISKYWLQRLNVDDPDSALGKTVDMITASFDLKKVQSMIAQLSPFAMSNPFSEEIVKLKIVGAWEHDEFGPVAFNRAIIPLEFSRQINRLSFHSVFDLLDTISSGSEYSSIYVRADEMKNVDHLIEQIEGMGYGTFSIIEQLSDIRKGFLFIDAILGAVGIIALVVASLGIINTMVMSVLERYREIGVMMAIGATNWEIKYIFFFETSVIGFIGGIFGILLGWIVTVIANFVANYYIAEQGSSHVNLFYIPLWLILGGILFAIFISLIAGLYPASKAAKVDPVKALRHE